MYALLAEAVNRAPDSASSGDQSTRARATGRSCGAKAVLHRLGLVTARECRHSELIHRRL